MVIPLSSMIRVVLRWRIDLVARDRAKTLILALHRMLFFFAMHCHSRRVLGLNIAPLVSSASTEICRGIEKTNRSELSRVMFRNIIAGFYSQARGLKHVGSRV